MRTLVLLSGGLDSAVLLAYRIRFDADVVALGVDYGQRHRRELDAARTVAAHYGIPFKVVDLSSVQMLLAGNALTTPDQAVPHDHPTSSAQAATVVPGRNALLIAAAVSAAAGWGAQVVATAVHADDHAVYPDCRPEFVAAAARVAELGTAGHGDVTVVAPFQHLTKAEVVDLGLSMGVPLDLTWTCYEGGAQPCGRCGACVERREAFDACGTQDPVQYADRAVPSW